MKYAGYVTQKVLKTVEIEEKVFKEFLPYKPLRFAVVSIPLKSYDRPVKSDSYVIGLFPSKWAAKNYIAISKPTLTRKWEVLEIEAP